MDIFDCSCVRTVCFSALTLGDAVHNKTADTLCACLSVQRVHTAVWPQHVATEKNQTEMEILLCVDVRSLSDTIYTRLWC